MPGISFLTAATSQLASVVTADMLSGVLTEVTGLLPVVLPVSISWLALRKGLGFLFSTIRRA